MRATGWFAILGSVLIAQSAAGETPLAPQPALTNVIFAEWRAELVSIYALRDNEFLQEEAAQDFGRRLAAWQGADVLLNMAVRRVTKEAVICELERLGGAITIRNEQEPPPIPREPGQGGREFVALRIGDVIPLETARTLRAGNQLAVRGSVATTSYQRNRALELEIAKGQAVAVVARSYAPAEGQRASARPPANLAEASASAPAYPANALAAGTEGQAVVRVRGEQLTLAQSSGNEQLDDAALQALRSLGTRNMHFYQGDHRISFTILPR